MKYKTPEIVPEQYLALLAEAFLAAGDSLRAEQQRAYTKHHFAYYGLTAPEWVAIAKSIFSSYGVYTGKQLEEFVLRCFDQEYRELHFAGLLMMEGMLKHQSKAWIGVLEKCIETQSWWDSVDWIAKLVGAHFKVYPELQHPYANKWIASGNMWLQRVAIIHQLFYREQTNEKLLFEMILRVADSKEFFLRKACGWALRQHAKVFPQHVEAFIESHTLSGLTIREAKKQLNKSPK
jgi:3-methyladenine DNA glycosylase AlkD